MGESIFVAIILGESIFVAIILGESVGITLAYKNKETKRQRHIWITKRANYPIFME